MPSLTPLLALLALTSTTTLAKPLARDEPVTFALTDINYSSNMVYSTPAHLATYGGTIQFNVTNNAPAAVPYVTKCSAYGRHLQDMFYGEIVYTCEQPVGAAGSTTFTFSRPDNSFAVNQTWTDYNGKTWFGQGSGKADLKCKSETWQNANWTMGQLYSTYTTTCETGSVTIVPTVVAV
ncbi:hypothetical protein BCR34DRAFT_591181 [Clohesyomyces aquaticus]|uniref:AA1-like domain-containing protein n=1 Tax=Clohesyomyces aquaticus TaxID=1231657 RepID=A0A1Y1Z376_9PLEO|nr:hypothetical protein BCR34DRAFT_591181 [Clohesyomyces aquaticus]